MTVKGGLIALSLRTYQYNSKYFNSLIRIIRRGMLNALHNFYTAKKVVFARSENKLWTFENAALFTHFLTFSEKKIQRSPVVFESANWSIRSIIQQFSSTVNSMKTIVFLVLRVRLTDGKTVCIPLFTGVFPVTKHCFHRRFPLKTMRFLPFSRTVNA